MKNKKIFFILLKLSLISGVIFILYKQLIKVTITDWKSISLNHPEYILISFLLVFFNWGIEWYKWLLTLDFINIKTNGSKLHSFRAFMAGILTGLLTPSMLGNFIGRVYYYERKDRPNIILGTFSTNYSQFFASIFFGILSIIILKETPWGFELNNLRFFLIGIAVLLLIFYFYFERIKVKKLNRKISYTNFIKLLTNQTSFRLKNLIYSLIRHFIFTLQFWLIFNAFEDALNLDTFLWIWQIFLWTTLLPSIWFGKLIIRESMALLVLGSIGFGQLEILSTSILLWCMNLAFPSLLSLFICKQKQLK